MLLMSYKIDKINNKATNRRDVRLLVALNLLNNSNPRELEDIDGIGETLSWRIYFNQPYNAFYELRELSYIGLKRCSAIIQYFVRKADRHTNS